MALRDRLSQLLRPASAGRGAESAAPASPETDQGPKVAAPSAPDAEDAGPDADWPSAEDPLIPDPTPTAPARTGPTPDRFGDHEWERRCAELEHIVGDKNRLILQMQADVAVQKQRLTKALVRLREAEETVEAQASVAVLDSRANRAGASPDVLAKLAAEKGTLETRVRQLTAERDRIARSHQSNERELRTLRDGLQSARTNLASRDANLATQEGRLEAIASTHAEQTAQLEARAVQAEEERARLQLRWQAARDALDKAEQTARNAEQQAALYRRNLLQAEEKLKSREVEVKTTQDERAKLQESLSGLRVKLQAGEKERANLEATLVATRRQAEKSHDEAERATRVSRDETTAARRRVAALEIAVKKADTAITGYKSKISTQEKALRTYEERLEEATAEVSNQTMEVSLREEALLAAQRINSRLELLATERLLDPSPAVAPGSSAGTSDDGARAGRKVGTLLRWLRRT